jgi:hypothetical protein
MGSRAALYHMFAGNRAGQEVKPPDTMLFTTEAVLGKFIPERVSCTGSRGFIFGGRRPSLTGTLCSNA